MYKNNLLIILIDLFAGNGMHCDKIDCGHPGLLLNGQIVGQNFTLDATVHFSCEIGYDLIGPSQRICQKSGTYARLITSLSQMYNF